MESADMVIGWMDNTGAPHFHDRFATGHTVPTIDGSQVIIIISPIDDS